MRTCMLNDTDRKIIAASEKVCLGYTLGADHEFIGTNAKGEAVSSERFLPPKETPKTVKLYSYTGHRVCANIFTDGRQGEFNFKPSHCREEMMRLHHVAIYGSQKICMAKKLDMNLKPIMDMSMEERMAGPLSMESGCNPDFSAWDGLPNPRMNDYPGVPFVMAGAHFHATANMVDINGKGVVFAPEDMMRWVQWCDVLIVPLIEAMLKDDLSFARRKFYGKSGCHRLPRPNGIEYRVLGANSIRHPALVSLIYMLQRKAGNIALVTKKRPSVKVSRAARKAIDTGDGCQKLALEVMEAVPSIYGRNDKFVDKVKSMITNGLRMTSVEKDWGLASPPAFYPLGYDSNWKGPRFSGWLSFVGEYKA